MLGSPEPESPPSDSVTRLLDRLKAAITELGYDAVIEDLSSPDLIGGEDSLLASQDVMVIPGYLEDAARPILLAATKGWAGNAPRSFTKIMHQIKARLIESRGATQTVVAFCDCWDSALFEEEHAEELRALANTGIRFSFYLVGVPDRNLVPAPWVSTTPNPDAERNRDAASLDLPWTPNLTLSLRVPRLELRAHHA